MIKSAARRERSCALFFVCAGAADGERRVPVCIFFLSLSVVSLAGAAAMVSYLVFSRSLSSSASDPITSVGIADGLLAAALTCGALASMISSASLTRGARDLLFHVAYASFLATSVLAFASARLVDARLGGDIEPPIDVEENKTTDDPLEPRSTDDGLVATPFATGPWSRRSLRRSIALTYATAAALSTASHFAEVDRSASAAVVLVPALVVSALLFAALLTYRRVGKSSSALPQRELRAVRRAILSFTVAHAVKALFVAMAAVVVSRTGLFGCDRRRQVDVARALMEVALASTGALDAVAFFSNIPWYQDRDDADGDAGGAVELAHSSSFAPWAQSIAPLHLVRIDEQSLHSAEIVGRGTFGSVRKLSVSSISSGRRLVEAGVDHVAVKSFAPFSKELSPDDTWLRQQLELLRNEAYQVASLHHRRIVSLYGIAESAAFGPCIVSEYLDGGSVFDRIASTQHCVFKEHPLLARRAARHVADALAYLHSKRLIHRDLKSANVLVAADGPPLAWRFKVADFGTSRVLLDNAALIARTLRKSSLRDLVTCRAAAFFDFRRDWWWSASRLSSRQRSTTSFEKAPTAAAPVQSNVQVLTTHVGTPLYMAPELLVKDRDYDTKIDVYSYGILLWETCACSTNWYAAFSDNPGPGCAILFRQVREGLRPPINAKFDPVLARLMKACWESDPADRPPFDKIHKTLAEIRDMSAASGSYDDALLGHSSPSSEGPAASPDSWTGDSKPGHRRRRREDDHKDDSSRSLCRRLDHELASPPEDDADLDRFSRV